MQWNKFALAFVIAMLALPVASQASGSFQDIVVDARGQSVRDSWGDCVLSKWMVDHNGCIGGRAASVYFDFNKSSLNGAAKADLDKLIDSINASGNKDNIQANVVGYADRIGNAKYNHRLSEKRATAVKKYLTKAGIKSGDIEVRAMGEDEPSTSCPDTLSHKDLVACLAQDRRVDIFLQYMK